MLFNNEFAILDHEHVFPKPEEADDSGLLAVGGDLSVPRLVKAYQQGIFPWYDAHSPILWWSPNPRMILYPEEFHLSKRMARVMRKGEFHLSADTAFEEVIHTCAAIPREDQDGTWILPEMEEAYTRLYQEGYAHSLEAWKGDTLAGGLYGISLGRCFFGESMFTTITNGSKAALFGLSLLARSIGIRLIDCQFWTSHLMRLGAREISRSRYLAIVKEEALDTELFRGSWNDKMQNTMENDYPQYLPREAKVPDSETQ